MVHPVIFSASTILFLIKFPKIHSFLFFLLFSFNLYPSTLATQSSDDFQLFVTIFVILLIIGLVISAAFALSLYFYVWYKRRENVGKQSFNNLNEYYKQQQKQQHVVKPVKRREAENVFWTEPQSIAHKNTIIPQPKQGPSFSERATKSFSNLKSSIQTKWQNLNLGGTKRIASPSSTVFPVEKPSTTSFYIPAQSPDNYVTIPEYSASPQIPQQIEERRRIKSILKKPKDNTKYSVITPSMCREAQQPIPRWQWNIREKSPYERVIEDRVEREENCVQGKLVAVERLVRTTTTTSKNDQQNIYWSGTGLNRTFI